MLHMYYRENPYNLMKGAKVIKINDFNPNNDLRVKRKLKFIRRKDLTPEVRKAYCLYGINGTDLW